MACCQILRTRDSLTSPTEFAEEFVTTRNTTTTTWLVEGIHTHTHTHTHTHITVNIVFLRTILNVCVCFFFFFFFWGKSQVNKNGSCNKKRSCTTTPEIEAEMQELVQMVLQNSSEDGMDKNIKQIFLMVAKTFYYSAYCDSGTINYHIAKYCLIQ